MKREKICVVLVVCAAETIIVGSPHDCDNIGAVNLPIGILEAVGFGIWMMQDDRSGFPLLEIGRTD